MKSGRMCIFLVVMMVLGTGFLFARGQQENEKPYIAVVSKGEQFDFWQQVRKGSEKAAEDFDVNMTFAGPPTENDVQIQVQMLNDAMAKDPVAICLAALSTDSVSDQLKEIKAKGIPVIGFDSGVPDAIAGSVYANASTNNYNAAAIAAEKMFELLKGKIESATEKKPVKFIILNQSASIDSLLNRGKGFRDTLIELIVAKTEFKKSDICVTGNIAYVDDINLTSGKKICIESMVPASMDFPDATATSLAAMNKVLEDNVIGIFCSNENMAKGILAATDDGASLRNTYKDLIIIGFDAGSAQKDAVRKGLLVGSITQDPFMMGYKTIELAYKAYKGEEVHDVDTGAKFYDKDNMDNDDIKGLLYD